MGLLIAIVVLLQQPNSPAGNKTLNLSYLMCEQKNPKTSTMPGLINKENRSALPLSVSDITSCVRGYTLAMTASMTYENIEDHAIEGECVHHRRLICLLQLCER